MAELSARAAGDGWARAGPIIACSTAGQGRKLGALGPAPLHPPRTAGHVAAAPCRMGGAARRIRPRIGRGRRRALAVFANSPVPREGWAARKWDEVRFTAQCTPFRHLGFFPDMAPVWDWMRGQLAGMRRRGRDAQPVRLYRRRHACAVGAARSPMSMPRRNRWRRRARTPRCPAWRTARSAGWSTTRPSSPRAKCGAGGAMTGSSSIRPSSGADRMARCGGWRSTCPA
jgi:hypothetical protein